MQSRYGLRIASASLISLSSVGCMATPEAAVPPRAEAPISAQAAEHAAARLAADDRSIGDGESDTVEVQPVEFSSATGAGTWNVVKAADFAVPVPPPVGTFPQSLPTAVPLAAPAPDTSIPGMGGSIGGEGAARNEVPIDLPSALALTNGQNPQVAYARERILGSYAGLEAARVLWVPTLRAGVNYNKHEGRIQDVEGNIIETSRGSVYTGLGAQAVGAGSPAVPGLSMNFAIRDSIFLPRIAEQSLGAARYASQAAANDAMLETALAYVELLEASQTRAVATETLENARQLVEMTASFAEAGEGLQADADRAAAELSARQIAARRAEENTRVAAVRLSRLISQDPTLVLVPAEPVIAPIHLIEAERDVQQLVSLGLSTRPELVESRFLVGEAVQRLRSEQLAPLVPSVLLGLSYGGNGGGRGGEINNFDDRLDFDAAAFWEVRNLGLGESAARDSAQSRVRQSRLRQVAVLDRVASEIVESHAQVVARREQIALAEAGITAARESYRRNTERIRNAQGLPIESLQALLALDQAQRLYVTTIADYNRAQFQLHHAVGFPAE